MSLTARRLTVAAPLISALALGTQAAGQAVQRDTRPLRHGLRCDQLFTPAMGRRAALRIYSGTRRVPMRGLRTLGYIERCQRDPRHTVSVRAFDRARQAEWWSRCHPPSWNGPDVASWYDDSASTASGAHFTYGFAALIFGSDWGRSVTFCVDGGGGRCAGPQVTGRLEDHGPYVGGRTFDFNASLKAALGCSDLCSVLWR